MVNAGRFNKTVQSIMVEELLVMWMKYMASPISLIERRVKWGRS